MDALCTHRVTFASTVSLNSCGQFGGSPASPDPCNEFLGLRHRQRSCRELMDRLEGPSRSYSAGGGGERMIELMLNGWLVVVVALVVAVVVVVSFVLNKLFFHWRFLESSPERMRLAPLRM